MICPYLFELVSKDIDVRSMAFFIKFDVALVFEKLKYQVFNNRVNKVIAHETMHGDTWIRVDEKRLIFMMLKIFS